MWNFLDKAKRYLREFVELGFLALLAILLIHLLLGEGAGTFVNSVAINVAQFTTDMSPQGLVGIAIVLAILYLLRLRNERRPG